ncbi:MAG: UDP-N-acetylglucosamine 4,6-dehydratase [Flavobacteriales bacterium]|nr:UDP-N-acetylglucosamine 4,6-dehydratase [Flavobacteriales bacterium]
MINHYNFLNRKISFFDIDIRNKSIELNEIVSNSTFLVLGGAGSIGQALAKEIFKRSPLKLHVVDISENNLVELVRDIRSSLGYLCKDFKTYALDINSIEYDRFIESDGKYDYVLNLSALKHVRSEKDPFTLMRMIQTNIFNTEKTINQAILNDTKKYFCVSTDKASKPVNMMGASKRIMELIVMGKTSEISISSARFANVLFSDGSLTHGFTKRIEKGQPIVAPNDIKRYFVTAEESGQLCLLSCIFGENREVFFPKFDKENHLNTFEELAVNFIKNIGYRPLKCKTEEQARDVALKKINNNQWPCYFSPSETTGEKDIEEFYAKTEKLELDLFESIGIIKSVSKPDLFGEMKLFRNRIDAFKNGKNWSRKHLIEIFKEVLEEFSHIEKGKFLDDKM